MRRTTVFVACALATGSLAAIGVSAGGCGIYGYGTATETTEAGPGADATLDAVADVVVADGPIADVADAGCPAGMITTSAGCIDAFEVTFEDYSAFAATSKVAGQPPECAWNTSYAVQLDASIASGKSSSPVAGVDWCDALAYCAFKSKRLCGKVGGGAAPFEAANDAGQDEWFAACSRGDDGQHVYPYGNSFVATICNTEAGTEGGTGRAPVGSFKGCGGGYPGLFDMSGNVGEWENSCLDAGADADAASTLCRTRGGGYDSGSDSICAQVGPGDLRSAAQDKVGFRCCSN
jgi:formylglycine-generating enzyme